MYVGSSETLKPDHTITWTLLYDVYFQRGTMVQALGCHDSNEGESVKALIPADVLWFWNWSDQKRLFKTAVEGSPSGCINVVFANAAIVKVIDPVVEDAVDEDGEPVEPNLDVVNIGIRGTLLTTKLAVHYFRRQLPKGDNDHCLVITASIAGYWDHPWHPQYAMMKWAARGLMRSLRSSLPENEMRVNIIAPW